VRDWLLAQVRGGAGVPVAGPIDLDVEVHGLEADQLEGVLAELGTVNLVGKAFSVWRTSHGGADVDVSLPRRDSRARPGHRGIVAVGDPHLGLVEAARRRDLTINAIAIDPLTGEVVDPFGGQRDLEAGVLRAVDRDTFGEDPLRALRVPQFAARFGFRVDPALRALCAAMPVHELPAERIHGELAKLLLLAPAPSWGVRVGVEAQLWRRVHPSLALGGWGPVYEALDRAVPLRDGMLPRQRGRAEALMLCALLHRVPADALLPVLDRLDVHRVARFPTRVAVLGALERGRPLRPPFGDGELRLLSRAAQDVGGLRLWLALLCALGHPAQDALARADQLGVGSRAPEPLVRGRDLQALGVAPGPAMGALLESLYERQLREGIERRGPLLDGLQP